MPGCLRSRLRFVGVSMKARNGQDAAASRSRGSVGKLMCGSDAGFAAQPDSSLAPMTSPSAAPATATGEPVKNLRRETLSISAHPLQGGGPPARSQTFFFGRGAMRDGTGMNVSGKFQVIPYITKDLTLRSSFARKACILLKGNKIARAVRLSPVFSTSACIHLDLPRPGLSGSKIAATFTKSNILPNPR